MNRLIATVAVEKTFFNLDSDYDYYVSEKDANNIKVGMLVKVPFGNGNRLRSGIVIKLYTDINSSLKEIHSISSDTAVLSDEMISLALWLKERCFCTTYDCLRQMLPRGLGKVGDKSSKMAMLAVENEEDLPKLTPKQRSVVNLLFDIGTASVNEICEFCSVGKGVLDNLVKYGIITYFDKQVFRTPYSAENIIIDSGSITLSKKQNDAYERYVKMLEGEGGTGLLFGVTGSGKTQVYLKLIDSAVELNKDVIVLVPEI